MPPRSWRSLTSPRAGEWLWRAEQPLAIPRRARIRRARTGGPVEAVGRVPERGQRMVRREPLSGAYFWLAAFFIVYCARPEDWIPGLHLIPIAKISGLLALLALLLSLGRARRRLQDLPLEILYLFLLIGQLFASAMISPVWRGGAFFNT